MTEVPIAESIVLYTDASFYLDSKISGAGIHGYTFTPEPPKKGTGNPKAVPTVKGYWHPEMEVAAPKPEPAEGEEAVVNKNLKGGVEKVTPIEYLDIILGLGRKQSNNEAELASFSIALNWLISNEQYKNIVILTDSKFVQVGSNKMLEKWERSNWITGSGQPVKYRAQWEIVKAQLDKLKATRESVDIGWVKSGGGFIGNDIADKHAERGAALTRNEDEEPIIETKPAQGYWGIKTGAPRLLQYPRWYFSTAEEEFLVGEDKAVYYVGCHGTKDKEDELNGKPYADNFFGVVIAKRDPVLEMIRQLAIERDDSRRGAVCIGRLDSIFAAKSYKLSLDYKTRFMNVHHRRIDINDADGSPIVVEQTPIGLGLRMIDSVNTLRRALTNVLAGDSYYRVTDVTNILYEGEGTKASPTVLSKKVTQITKYIDLAVEFNLTRANEEASPFVGNIRLILGSDILSRNQMAALAGEVKSIKVVTWRESDTAGRYATLVEMNDGDIGLWARNKANIFLKGDRQ